MGYNIDDYVCKFRYDKDDAGCSICEFKDECLLGKEELDKQAEKLDINISSIDKYKDVINILKKGK
ncbi:MAG: hypothetical protein WC934_11825 [Acidithiobacillus sp.]|uniref:hypothetical protein n=1 Tax=Acidithiobacillus sp. TaxID=1872118 RepID=UPI003560B7C3